MECGTGPAASRARAIRREGALAGVAELCGAFHGVAVDSRCDADVDHDTAVSGLGSAIKLRRRTTRRRCDSCSGLEAAIAQRT